jgi:hypothetical protein
VAAIHRSSVKDAPTAAKELLNRMRNQISIFAQLTQVVRMRSQEFHAESKHAHDGIESTTERPTGLPSLFELT